MMVEEAKTKTVTLIVNDAPYGIERAWNALRLAGALITCKARVNLFLLGDAVVAVKAGQETPTGYYNTEQMIRELLAKGATVHA
jgi:uncharacterized protein involved in oxidation of intracellular sulfur